MDEGTTMKSVKIAIALTLMSVMSVFAAVIAPPANAAMRLGNYDVLTNRYERASWVWFVSACPNPVNLDCLKVSATPRLKFYAYYEGYAHIENGQYTLRVDVADGLQCLPGYAMPTHETWTWDPRHARRKHRLAVRRGLLQRSTRIPILDLCATDPVTSNARRRCETAEQLLDASRDRQCRSVFEIGPDNLDPHR